MPELDGNPVEMATFLVAVLVCFIRPLRHARRHESQNLTFGRVAADLFSGTTIVPFILLICSVFSSVILEATLQSNKLALGLGGVIGLMFVVRGYFVGD